MIQQLGWPTEKTTPFRPADWASGFTECYPLLLKDKLLIELNKLENYEREANE